MLSRNTAAAARRAARVVAVSVALATMLVVLSLLPTHGNGPWRDQAAYAADFHAGVDGESDTEGPDPLAVSSDPDDLDIAGLLMLASLVGFSFIVVVALVVGWRDTTIRSVQQLTKSTGVTNLAEIPCRPSGGGHLDQVAVLRDSNSAEAGAYVELHRTLELAVRDRAVKVLLVASPHADEGKSSVAVNLAAVVSKSGRKVVVVDGDLRRPQLHRLLESDNELGLSSVLRGDAPMQRCVQRLDLEGKVALLSAGPPPPDPADLLSGERLRLAVESLASASDLVVIDAPPVLSVNADLINLARVADAALVVATEGLSDRREMGETLERLGKFDVAVIGTVLRRLDSADHLEPASVGGVGSAATDAEGGNGVPADERASVDASGWGPPVG